LARQVRNHLWELSTKSNPRPESLVGTGFDGASLFVGALARHLAGKGRVQGGARAGGVPTSAGGVPLTGGRRRGRSAAPWSAARVECLTGASSGGVPKGEEGALRV
jgi:hypothetical protein